MLKGKVDLVEALGAETLVYVSTDSGVQLVARQIERTELTVGNVIGLHIDVDAAHLFDAKGQITRTGAARETLVH
jgi:multiple sugar transport system ATP-binding protein